MSEWYVIRHERPYDDEDAFIEAEGWTLTTKSMVLVGHPDLNIDQQVRCYVTLASGTTLVKAEGIVMGYRAATGDRPGGLEVRFKRIGADTQRLIKRCAERQRAKRPPAPSSRARKQQYSVLDLELDAPAEEAGERVSIPDLPPERVSIPEPEPEPVSLREVEPEPVSLREVEPVSIREAEPEPEPQPQPQPEPEPEREPEAQPAVAAARPAASAGPRGSLDALRARPLASVTAPDNRAELLERLRKRSSY